MTTDIEQELRSALRASTADVHLSPRTPHAVRARARRHRRRNVALAATSVVTVVAVTVTAVALDLVAPSDTSSVVVSTTPTASATASATDLGPGRVVGGVAVTYLPDGLSWHGPDSTGYDPNEYENDLGEGTVGYHSSFDRAADRQPGLFPDSHSVGVTAAWNPHYTVDELEAIYREDQPTWSVTRTTVRGHEALAISRTETDPGSLLWHEQDNLELHVGLSAPLTTEDLRRVAEGLVVRYQVDTRLVPTRTNFENAVISTFNGGADTATSLAAVDEADSLVAVREEMVAEHPDLIRSMGAMLVATGSLDETHAEVTFTVIFEDQDRRVPSAYTWNVGPSVAVDIVGRFVLTDSGWKMERATFCEVANLLISHC